MPGAPTSPASSLALEDAIDRQLQQQAGLPHLYYSVLANLSEAPDRRLRMTDLAASLKVTRSRLTYAVARLEKDGTVRREACPGDGRGSIAVLTEGGGAAAGADGPGARRDGTRRRVRPATPEQVEQFEEICATDRRGAGQRGGAHGIRRRAPLAAPLLRPLNDLPPGVPPGIRPPR